MKKDDIFRFLFLYIYYIISILCNVFKSPHANVRVFVSYTVGRKRKSEQFSYTIPLIEKIPVLQWSAWRWWWWPPQRLWTKDRRNNKLWRRWPGRCSAGQRISARCRQGPPTIYVQGSFNSKHDNCSLYKIGLKMRPQSCAQKVALKNLGGVVD